MAKYLGIGSTLITALMLLSTISSSCLSEITQSGIVCDITNSYVLYDDKTKFCTAVDDASILLNYCKIAACTICDANLNGCKDLIGVADTTYVRKYYTSDSTTQTGECKLTLGEDCYRNADHDDAVYLTNYGTGTGSVLAGDAECCMYECYNYFLVQSGACGSDGTFYTDLDVFCQSRCVDRNLTLTQCGNEDCGTAQGCPDSCLTDTANPPFCSDTFVYYSSIATFCDDKSNGLVSTTVSCSPDCSTNGCNNLKCIDNNTDYSLGSICLDTKLSGLNYYETITSYCTAKVSAGESDYAITSYTACSNNACSSQETCCIALCESEAYFDTCNSTTFNIVDQSTYCAYRCANGETNMDVLSCLSGGSQSACTDCSYFACQNALTTVLFYTTVCGIDYVYYTAVDDYCSASGSGYATGYILCHAAECADSTACCNANCVADNIDAYAPKCNTTDYTYHGTVERFCDSYCPSQTYNTYFSSGVVLATETECCVAKCIAKGDKADLCNASTFSISTVTDQCNNECISGTDTYLTCDVTCDASACAKLSCLSSLTGYTDTDVICGSNDVFYDNKSLFCDAYIVAPSITDVKCPGGVCPDSATCCTTNCSIAENSDFTTTCDTRYNSYTTYTSFCDSKCTDANFVLADCSGNRCTSTECCEIKCNADVYIAVCSPDFALLDQPTYCSASCAAQTYTPITCNGGCDLKKCEVDKCLYALKDYEATICLSTEFNSNFFYSSKELYCSDKYVALDTDYTTDTFLSCLAGVCTSETCIEAICMEETIYTTCDNLANLITKESYCAYRGTNNGTNMSVTGCTDIAHTAVDCIDCNIIACYNTIQAVYDSPGTVCANNYTFYDTKQDYCAGKELDSSIAYNPCGVDPCDSDYNCCLAVCDVQNSTDFTGQCNTTDYIYVSTVDYYCLAFCKNLLKSFTPYKIDNVLATEAECFDKKCKDVDLTKVACSRSDYNIISIQDQCDQEFAGSTPDVYTCNGVDCTSTDCDIAQCIEVTMVAYKNDATFCTNDSAFYTNLTTLCTAFVANGTLQYVSCNGSACADEIACCAQNCTNEYTGSFETTCDADYNIYNLVTDYCNAKCGAGFNEKLCSGTLCNHQTCCTDECNVTSFVDSCIPSDSITLFIDRGLFCTAYCANPDDTPTVENCAGAGCAQTDCSIYYCIANTTGNQCGNNGVFYSDVTAYCTAKENESLADVSCGADACKSQDECCLADCVIDFPEADYTARCDAAFTIYSTRDSFCTAVCVNNPPTNIGLNCSADTLCTVQECCEQKCNAESYTVVCDPSYIPLTQSKYCTASCSDNTYLPITCTGDCNKDKCDTLKCLNDLSGYSKSYVCLATAYESSYFFPTVNSYCSARVAANDDTTYVEPTSLTCASDACSETECCKARCLTETYYVSCDGSSNLVQHDAFCSYRCAHSNTDMDINRCLSNPDTDPQLIDCVDCASTTCLADINNRYASPDTVCGNNDTFYNTKVEYCTAKVDDNTINLRYCASSTPCSDDTDCCKVNCVQNNSTGYIGKCNITDFVFHSTVDAYCDSYCPSRSYTSYMIIGNLATETQCCKQACLNKNDKQDLCNSTTFDLLTVDQQCDNECGGPSVTGVDCDGGACDQEMCNLKKCTNIDLAAFTNVQSVCGNDIIFYGSKLSFCMERESNNSSLAVVACGGSQCGSEGDCRYYNCIANETAGYNTTCDTNYTLYTTVENYCTAFREVSFDPKMCSLAHCSHQECCTGECNAQAGFIALCIPSLDATLYDNQETYCTTKCSDPDNIPTADNCTSGCVSSDCQIKRCEFTNADQAYCDNLGAYYVSDTEYCTALQVNADLTSITCNGDICADSVACCEQACHNNNPEATYEPRCDSAFTYLSTRDSYCTAYCANTATYANLYCDNANTVLCNEIECCNKNCIKEDYSPVCDNTYSLMTEENYCTAYCNNNSFIRHECGGGCDADKCNIQKCLADLTTYSYTSVCLVKPVNNTTFFATHELYCDAKNTAGDNAYSLETDEYYTCDNGNCDLEVNCCKVSCLVNQTLVGCNGTTLVTPSDYCDNHCAKNPDFTLDYCGTVDCPNCDIAACMKANSTYTLDQVCLKDIVGADNFYDSLFLYCEAKVKAADNIYDLTGKYDTCDGGNCTTTTACCEANCNSGSYTSLCKPSDHSLVSQASYCTLSCASEAGSLLSCYDDAGAQINCTAEICTDYDCIQVFKTATYAYSSICLNSQLETDTYFYDTIIGYCSAKIGLGISDNTVPSYTACDDSGSAIACVDIAACCEARCLAETYNIGCTDAAELINHATFCNHRCSGGSDYSLTYCEGNCADCNPVQCLLDNAAYTFNTVCLKTILGSSNYYATKTDYCTAMIFNSKSDYLLEVSEYFLCDSAACNAEGCTQQICLANDYTAVCDSATFTLLDHATYCSNISLDSSNTGYICTDADLPVACTASSCCSVELTSATFPTCTSTGTVYDNSDDYCLAKTTDASLTITSLTSISFPSCGSDYSLYSDLSAYCTALNANADLVTIDACGKDVCTDNICCLARCPTVANNPIVVLQDGPVLTSFENECYGHCAIADANIVKTCEDQNENDCKATYCEEVSFCGSTTDADYYEYSCGKDGVVYDNSCQAGCHNQFVIDTCPKKCTDDSWRLKRCRYECQITLVEL